jgi:acetolactate synthase-1/2/3 large subunit
MRVADYIFKYLADYGIKNVFLVTGGGAMHLNDALKKEKRIKYICNHHEQGAAIAAEGYARTSGKLAVVNVTSGPGGTNALTGVIGQWLDSVPVLYLSGQIKYETTITSVPDSRLRQLGDQEINIIDIVKPVTKYAKMITDPETIKCELDRAVYIAVSGRPGPVWLDIPLDVQSGLINEQSLQNENMNNISISVEDEIISEVIQELQKAERPVLIAGHGVRISKAKKQFLELVDLLDIPVVTTFNGFDLIASESDNFIGRIGTLTVKGDILIHSDAKVFITKFLEKIPDDFRVDKIWLEWCLMRKKKYPVVLDEYKILNEHSVHPYHFIEELTTALNDNAIVVAGNGTACVALFQAGIVKTKQRIFWNSGCAAMGYGLPASIGAALAGNRDIVCITGDGSIQMNLQELQTIKHYNLPIKIFILNNQGYRSIEMTQAGFFNSNFIGCNKESGVSFPDNSKLADLYDLKYYKIDSTAKMGQVIDSVLSYRRALICEVILNKDHIFAPRVSSERKPDGRMVSKPLEDLYPFLERDEFYLNMCGGVK